MQSLTQSGPQSSPNRAPSRLALTTVRLARRASGLFVHFSDRPLPRFGTFAFTVVGAAVVYGVVVGGHIDEVLDGIGQPLGFSIEQIDVQGNSETSEIDVLQALWQTGAHTLLSLDPAQARQTIESMPWVDRASVAKILPDRVKITLSEHHPYAVWQIGDAFQVVNREGKTIVPFTPGRFGNLPVVVGTGAAGNAAELIDDMEVLPELRARVKAYIRVGDRRWDLQLENGVLIRLPEEKPIEALAEVDRMDRENGLLSRDIAAVDMRLDDRMVIKLTPDALVRRNARLEEREKIIKRNRKDKPV
ncbi:cell division protein FtsQ/DivIB [Aurantimonas sp. VKM B-3413]|uniref:cell division protein FtsQ/DivIB n=1 Tax=Aurantimonas sp. VKM B-3413 TaxID=2779401 RepID=UPI001E32C369|nr:cell division protein FtsQ/DivIB [Aurantimonas sp. VKM B-3413]MCB8837877.1 cell division protein FtsQ/DivIB [Aurantimonas sp. VKM B-3413]